MGFPMQDVRDVALMHSLAMSSPKANGRYLIPQVWVMFYEFCRSLNTDKRTKRMMLPLFTLPRFPFKAMFGVAAPMLGLDKSLPSRAWGNTVTYDLSKVKADFELDAQGYKMLPIATSMVDQDLTFRKYKISSFSKSLGRY